ncbi:hypothetical protein ACHAW6_010956 [Cyclotella cf. meneghiniana]
MIFTQRVRVNLPALAAFDLFTTHIGIPWSLASGTVARGTVQKNFVVYYIAITVKVKTVNSTTSIVYLRVADVYVTT